ncbi:MAG: hypothetical protein EPO68_07685 [Planctomycetota bacterium]|nr:MAG: hypothetical protein EPO68_07685 [Planctomycetota bacterium]
MNLRTAASSLAALAALSAAIGLANRGCATPSAESAARAPAVTRESNPAPANMESAPSTSVASTNVPSAIEATAAGTETQRAVRTPSALVLRGVLHAPRNMPLPAETRLVIGEQQFVALDAAGRFEFAWPSERDVLSIHADAATLSDVVLARMRRTHTGELASEHSVAQFHGGELALWAHSACIVVGRLSAEPSPLDRAADSEPVRVRLSAAYDWQRIERTWSGAPGDAFRFEHVPLSGSVSLHVEGATLWVHERLVEGTAPGATIDVGVIGEHAYPLHGHLYDDRGVPVAGGGVRAYAREPDGKLRPLGTTETDDSGRFDLPRVPLLPLVFRACHYEGDLDYPTMLTTQEFGPSAAAFEAGIELRLASLVHLAGIVLRPDGSAVADAFIRFASDGVRHETEQREGLSDVGATTDALGRFGFDVKSGRTELCVWEDRHVLGGPNLVACVEVLAPDEAVVVRLAPIAPLRGRVVLDDGTPWNERWTLEAWCKNVVVTDSSRGTYDASVFENTRLWPGRWRVRARTPRGLTSPMLELDVPADLEREHVLVLRP